MFHNQISSGQCGEEREKTEYNMGWKEMIYNAFGNDYIYIIPNKRAMKQSTIQKKCCYMDRDCTSACVAYTAASELGESAKQMGMNSLNCMRLLLDLTELMERVDSDDFDEEDEDII